MPSEQSQHSIQELAQVVRNMFGDCDCRVVGQAEAAIYSQDLQAANVALDRLVEQLEAADAALRWVADNYPKAMREMPTPLFRALTSNPAKRPSDG